jgi:regulator of cell morphogenesis and NO signaling
MAEFVSCNQLKDRYVKTLQQYIPVVVRVHGSHHPEIYQVQSVFAQMIPSMQDATDLLAHFLELREITDTYSVPQDVCESYAAVYHMLEYLDRAYHE